MSSTPINLLTQLIAGALGGGAGAIVTAIVGAIKNGMAAAK
jgi:hypothetical protein